MYKILIVEDNEKLCTELKTFLGNNGYEVSNLSKFDNCIDDILKSNCNLVLLDINLPILNGEYICKELRKVSNTPIVIITSISNELDELISINYGADDYITKPFNTQILLARIASILKRAHNETSSNILRASNFVLNLTESTLEKDDTKIELTKNERKILQFLITNTNKIVSRDEIMDYLWNTNEFIDDNTLTVNITRVRNKLEKIGCKNIIETKRGQGYILNEV